VKRCIKRSPSGLPLLRSDRNARSVSIMRMHHRNGSCYEFGLAHAKLETTIGSGAFHLGAVLV